MFSTVPLLTFEECLAVRDRIQRIRLKWIDRTPGYPDKLFTIGVAAYLDATDVDRRSQLYYERAIEQNQLLRDTFKDVYRKIADALQSLLKTQCVYDGRFALPGFHIFTPGRLRNLRNLTPHFDHQFYYLPELAECDCTSAISFTLPIRLPDAGGGLDYWEATSSHVSRDIAIGRIGSSADYCNILPQQFLRYSLGNLVVQRQLLLHRISETIEIRDGDLRITLQGHGVKVGEQYVLYW